MSAPFKYCFEHSFEGVSCILYDGAHFIVSSPSDKHTGSEAGVSWLNNFFAEPSFCKISNGVLPFNCKSIESSSKLKSAHSLP